MERKIASQIIDAAMALNEKIGAVDLAITGIADEEEKRRYVAVLGGILRIIREDILLEILKDHPDLNPHDT
ncbi:MAG: hypothetical protein AB1490_14655 [Pseudomonadota bacterium]